jgi:hypothetical protein
MAHLFQGSQVKHNLQPAEDSGTGDSIQFAKQINAAHWMHRTRLPGAIESGAPLHCWQMVSNEFRKTLFAPRPADFEVHISGPTGRHITCRWLKPNGTWLRVVSGSVIATGHCFFDVLQQLPVAGAIPLR